MRVGLMVLALVVVGGACKKRTSYDQSSPEAALHSFFTALEAGRLGKELDRFVEPGREHAAWKFRCDHGECKRGTVAIRARHQPDPFRATLIADYEVFDEHGGRVVHGTSSPVELVRHGEVWKIAQFGRLLKAGTGAPPPAVPDDASNGAAPRDAGSSNAPRPATGD